MKQRYLCKACGRIAEGEDCDDMTCLCGACDWSPRPWPRWQDATWGELHLQVYHGIRAYPAAFVFTNVMMFLLGMTIATVVFVLLPK